MQRTLLFATLIASAPLSLPAAQGAAEGRVPVHRLPGDSGAHHVITRAGSYYLQTELEASPGMNAIEIRAGQVTLDLNGYTVRGMAGSGHGILSVSPDGDVVIRNGYVRECGGDGIRFEAVGEPAGPAVGLLRIDEVHSSGNGGSGVSGQLTTAVVVTRCDLSDNGGSGFAWDLDPAPPAQVADFHGRLWDTRLARNLRGVTATADDPGAMLDIDRCVIDRNTDSGIDSTMVDANVRDSRLSHNGGHGVSSADGPVFVVDTWIDHNGQDGVRVHATTPGESAPPLSVSGSRFRANAGMDVSAQASARSDIWRTLFIDSSGVLVGDGSVVSDVVAQGTGGAGTTGISVGHNSTVRDVRASGFETGVQTGVRGRVDELVVDGNFQFGLRTSFDSWVTGSFGSDNSSGFSLLDGTRLSDSFVLGNATGVEVGGQAVVQDTIFAENLRSLEVNGDDSVVYRNLFRQNITADVQVTGSGSKVATFSCDVDAAGPHANIGPPFAPGPCGVRKVGAFPPTPTVAQDANGSQP